MISDTVAVVMRWHAALNDTDADGVARLVTEDVELAGPRGIASGAAIVRQWVEQAGIRLDPQRVFADDRTVVVEQRAAWRMSETGEFDAPQDAATVFHVHDGRIAYINRLPTVADALLKAGLTEADEVRHVADEIKA